MSSHDEGLFLLQTSFTAALLMGFRQLACDILLAYDIEMRGQRSLWNFLSGFFFSVLIIAVNFLAAPILLKTLGTELYGLYFVLLDWLGYLALFEFGLTESLLPAIARAVARGQRAEIEDVLAAGVRAHFKLLAFKLVFGIGLVWFLPDLVGNTHVYAVDLQIACLIGISTSFLSPLLPFRTVMDAEQKGYRVNLLLSFQSVLIALLSLWFAKSGFGIKGQFLAILIGQLPFYLFLLYFSVSRMPGLIKKIVNFNPVGEIWNGIWKLNRVVFVSQICSRISLMSDKLILGSILGPAKVVPFVMTQGLINAFQGQIFSIGGATWPALSDLLQKNETKIFEQRILELTRLTVCAAFIFLGPMVCYTQQFMTLWIGHTQFSGHVVVVMTAINILLMALVALWSNPFTFTGKFPYLLKQYIVSTCINLVASISFTYAFGLAGPVLGTFVAICSVSIWILPKKLESHFGVSRGMIFYSVTKPVLCLLPLVTALWFFANENLDLNWFSLGFHMSVAGLVLALFCWRVLLTGSERREWQARIQKSIPFLHRP